jgi:hypothetical protein
MCFLENNKLTNWSSIPTGGGFISAHALTKLVSTVGGIAEKAHRML